MHYRFNHQTSLPSDEVISRGDINDLPCAGLGMGRGQKSLAFEITKLGLFHEVEPNWDFCVNSFHSDFLSVKFDFSNIVEYHSNS
jgi:hypothetical protein